MDVQEFIDGLLFTEQAFIDNGCLKPIFIAKNLAVNSRTLMHWRCGYFRKLPGGNIIPVSPTVVNSKDHSLPHEDYEVVF